MDEWTPSQALAVYDFCQLLSETIWQRYQSVLIDEMIATDRRRGFEHLEPVNDNPDLTFDDDPF